MYIDILFLLNFLMNSATIFATSLFLKVKLHIIRLLLSSALCALYASVMFFPQISFMYSTIFKILFWLLTVRLSFPADNIVGLFKNAVVFFSVNLIFGGFLFALIFATDFGTTMGAVISNGIIYLNISPGIILLSAFLACAIVFTISFIKKQKLEYARRVIDVQIFFNGKNTTVKALCDTGCNLREPISGAPALIISPETASELLPSDFPKNNRRYRILPFCTVDNSNSFMHGFIPDKILLENTEILHSVVGISNTKLADYSAILNPELLETNTRKVVNKYETCSTV